MNKKRGIYQIFNTRNGKIYVGQSLDIEKRFKQHKSMLRHNKHENSHLQNAWNKYGERAFEFKILKVCKPRYLDRFEKLYIRIWGLQNPNHGYNKESGGNLNKTVSEETKRKISKNHADVSGENHPMYNKKHTKEARRKISGKLKGKYKGENNPMYDKKHSEETRRKMSKNRSEKYNTTGFYRVSVKNSSSCKRGFIWYYQYQIDYQRKSISSTDLNKLKEKVLEKNLEWQIIDEEKAKQSLKKDIGD